MRGRMDHSCHSKGGKVEPHEEKKHHHAKNKREKRGKKVHGDESAHRLDKRARGGKWIQGAIKRPGALHRALHVPEGEKIPAAKMAKASHSENPRLRRMAGLAKTLKKMH